ncbi:hypothetical protein, partial [Acinetobacter baumannii]|uniref:hypothetical protein n=1 Tax=Acinetobacter baumannii TaxID=470 RepID=UPI003D291078
MGRTQANVTLLRAILTESGINPDKVAVSPFSPSQKASALPVRGDRRRGREDAAGDLLGLVERMLLRDRFGNVDRQEFRFAARIGGCRDGVGGDLAVERTDRHEGVDRGIFRHLGDLARTKLADRHLVRIDAGLG